ncbi:MAG: hypothetical protein AB1401_09630 [Thermodesulfobacteriota bacterium]
MSTINIKEIIEKEIHEDDIKTRSQFMDSFKGEVSAFIDGLTDAFYKWEEYDSKIDTDIRKAYVSAFLYNAIDSLTLSMKLFLSGYIIPSGNLLRYTLESLCLAILCSDKSLPYYEKIEQNKFSANAALNCVLKNAEKLNIIKESIETLKGIYEYNHNYSHATLLSLYHIFSKRGEQYFGPSFDKGKMVIYKKETETRVNLAKVFSNIIEGILHG